MDADAIVVGAGLAGLVAAAELADAGRRIIILDQEGEASLGGQAFWSFGGLFFVDSPEQRRLRIRDSRELALQDWLGSAGFDRDEDHWPRRWAEAYVDFAAGEKRAWLRQQGLKIFPIVGWAERGGYLATGHGNSVPRFHVTWGTGPGVIEPFVRRVREAEARGLVSFRFRHRVTATDEDRRRGRRRAGRGAGAERCGTRHRKLAPRWPARSRCARRRSSSRRAASAAIMSWCGAIGRSGWATPPRHMISGVPEHVDGLMLDVAKAAGAQPHQLRPHVALPGRHPELCADLERATASAS